MAPDHWGAWIGVATTRKHFPGTKAMSLKAVLAGGGSVHRLGLSDSILIFAEHRRFLAGEAPEAAGPEDGQEGPQNGAQDTPSQDQEQDKGDGQKPPKSQQKQPDRPDISADKKPDKPAPFGKALPPIYTV